MFISKRSSVNIVRRSADCTLSGPLFVIRNGRQVGVACTRYTNILFLPFLSVLTFRYSADANDAMRRACVVRASCVRRACVVRASCMRACVRAWLMHGSCVRACMRACVAHACVRACVAHACVNACVRG